MKVYRFFRLTSRVFAYGVVRNMHYHKKHAQIQATIIVKFVFQT